MNATAVSGKNPAKSPKKAKSPPASAPAINPETHAPSGKPWSYGIRTWGPDGVSFGGFKWDLTIGARTVAQDWDGAAVCGSGLHANEDGWGDWSLLGLHSEGATKVVGIVRWDPDLAVRIDGHDKTKAPWMEVVMTSQTASLASVLGFINGKWRERLFTILQEEGSKTNLATGSQGHASATGSQGHASATGSQGHASATGDYGHASATGSQGHASATGDYGHASATGDYGHASATGSQGHASATGYKGHASATGDYGHASATGDYGHASATGSQGHASATGYKGHASAKGEFGIAAAMGGGPAKAVAGGAIMLSAWEGDYWDRTRKLVRVFASMVGETHGDVTIQADTYYRLNLDGTIVEVPSDGVAE